MPDPVDEKERAAVRGWSTISSIGVDRIYLLLVYAKGVKDNLTRAEENDLRKLARALEEES